MVRWGWLSALLALGAGCAAQVSGEINGQDVPVQSAYYIQDSGGFGDDDHIQVILSSVSGACSRDAEWAEAYNELGWDDLFNLDEELEDLETLWSELYPSEWWSITVDLRVDDLESDLNGEVFDGLSWSESLTSAGQARADFVFYERHLTVDGLLSLEDLDIFESDGGKLEINSYSSDKRISGAFETTAVEGFGDDEGEVDVRFRASRCEDVERERF